MFREKQAGPSVVNASASAARLKLCYDNKNRLMAQTGKAGSYDLTMSDGTKRKLVVERDSKSMAIAGPWKTTKQDEKGFSVLQETSFNVPSGFGKDERVYLHLGSVSVMAKVTLNGKTYDMIWMPPFKLDVTDVLKSGGNNMKVLVTSTTQGKPKLGEVRLKTVTRQVVGE